MSYWRENGETDPKTIFKKAVDNRLRAERFGKAAKDRFNDDYGFRQGQPYDNDYMEVCMGGDFGSTAEFGPHAVGYRNNGRLSPKKYEYGSDRYTYQDMTPEQFFQGNEDAAQKFHNAEDEIKKYYGGKYSYEKGKGYTANESTLRRKVNGLYGN